MDRCCVCGSSVDILVDVQRRTELNLFKMRPGCFCDMRAGQSRTPPGFAVPLPRFIYVAHGAVDRGHEEVHGPARIDLEP